MRCRGPWGSSWIAKHATSGHSLGVARQLRHWVAEPSPCAYLPDRLATLEYRLLLDVTGPELDAILERGWRRFGPAYFRPAC
ncbi:MAG: hypothetical protein AAFZ18_35110, partial [Myxococcota bacterium]